MNQIKNALKDNLCEIYVGLEKQKFELIPSPIGKRIYFSEAGIGIICTLFFRIFNFFMGPDFQINKMKQALASTESFFSSSLKEAVSSIDQFEKALVNKIEMQKKAGKKEYKKLSWNITDWNNGTKYFTSDTSSKKEMLHKLFNRFYPGKDCALSVPKEISKKFKKIQRIIDLETCLETPAPFSSLRKLAEQKELSAEDEKIIDTWITTATEKKSKINVAKFHQGLACLITHISEKHTTAAMVQPDLARLETELARRNLKIFNQPDPKVHALRKDHKPGSEVKCNDKVYILDKEIPSKKTKDNNNQVFTLQNDPDHVLIFGTNTAILATKKFVADEVGSCMQSAEWKEVDKKGVCALVEKLGTPLSEIKWSDKKKISPDDIKNLDPICKLVDWWIEQNKTPRNLNINTIRFSKEGVIKSTIPMLAGEFNFPVVVNFFQQCAKNNPAAFKYLMNRSTILKQIYVKYYNQIVEETFKEKPSDPEDVAASLMFKITDPNIISEAKCLRKNIKKLQKKIMASLLKKYEIEDPLKISVSSIKHFLRLYRFDQSICFIWNDMKKRIIKEIVSDFKLQKKESQNIT